MLHWIYSFGRKLRRSKPRVSSHLVGTRGRTPRLTLEHLETRLVPYSVSGNAWPAPQLITISFVPDNTVVSTSGSNKVGSDLFSTFNSRFGSTAAWENIILKAAQVWAQQTNINCTSDEMQSRLEAGPDPRPVTDDLRRQLLEELGEYIMPTSRFASRTSHPSWSQGPASAVVSTRCP